MNVFLEELSKQYLDDMILLCCDGAACHKSQSLQVPENIELFYIPPYTPEMNPIEQIWKELRNPFFFKRILCAVFKLLTKKAVTILIHGVSSLSSL